MTISFTSYPKPSDSYNNLNNIEEISFAAGSDQTLEFTAYEDSSWNFSDLASGTWLLCPYGHYNNDLDIAYSLNTSGHLATLSIPGSSTVDLAGKYIQQLVLQDSSGERFIGQGIVIITPSGNS